MVASSAMLLQAGTWTLGLMVRHDCSHNLVCNATSLSLPPSLLLLTATMLYAGTRRHKRFSMTSTTSAHGWVRSMPYINHLMLTPTAPMMRTRTTLRLHGQGEANTGLPAFSCNAPRYSSLWRQYQSLLRLPCVCLCVVGNGWSPRVVRDED